jgi:hypothetical protein
MNLEMKIILDELNKRFTEHDHKWDSLQRARDPHPTLDPGVAAKGMPCHRSPILSPLVWFCILLSIMVFVQGWVTMGFRVPNCLE